MSNPEIMPAPNVAFEGQPADSQPWDLHTGPDGEGRVRFPETGAIWAAWDAEGFQADVFIRNNSTGRAILVVAPPSNYDVTQGDELTWKLRSPNLPFRLGWGYLQGTPTAS